ncbi:MAG: hypothetical protein QOK11_3808 [Pseudonocardiales bacterium]|jgi:hypothetical protein|nr:hypothetical protein [Pseudonocardiales bacterium]MDT4943893.1 hypothetical protein [Pseudonocardiales bacterium]
MSVDRQVAPVLLLGIDDAWQRLRARLTGLTQQEYLWEPVGGCWSVRLVDGQWQAQRSERDPQPAPVTTVAWRMWHIASDCLASYVSPSLGDWPLPVRGAGWFGDVEPALDALVTSFDAFRSRIDALGEDGMWRQLGPDWGPYAESTWADLVVHALDELAHHGAEIALLRDLYPQLSRGE